MNPRTKPPGDRSHAGPRAGPREGHSTPSEAERAQATWMGLGALVLWSATIPLTRMLSEALGTTTAASAMLLLGGALGLLHRAWRGALGAMWRLPRAYLLGCGSLFVGYMTCLYLAVGLAQSRLQVVEVGILNYLWPALTLLFAVPLTGLRVRPRFWAAVLVAMVGAAMAPLPPEAHSFARLAASWHASPWAYPLALGAAVCWGLYSVLSRRWAGQTPDDAVPLFTFASGLALGGLRLARPEESHLDGSTLLLLGFMAVFPVLVAYGLWDRAVRKGNLPLVAAASYGAPIVSTLLSWWLLDVELRSTLWLGCALVAGGALVAERSVLAAPPAGDELSEERCSNS